METAQDGRFGHRKVDHASILRFGRLTGDQSPIHFDPEVGRQAGYGGAIAHGLLSACWAVGAVTRHQPERLSIGTTDAIASAYALRLTGVVRVEDEFAVQLAAPEVSNATAPSSGSVVSFETVDQNHERTSAAELTVHRGSLPLAHAARTPWRLSSWQAPEGDDTLYAEDIMQSGPRGVSSAHSMTESLTRDFCHEVGESNPLYLDTSFAKTSIFESRLVPPMLSFCLAFSDFLGDLLTVELPSQGFAGHVGDRWRLLRPIHVGDTLETHHKPLEVRRSMSRPDMGIVRFGLQVVNQRDRVVQEGETIMLIPTRSPEPSA